MLCPVKVIGIILSRALAASWFQSIMNALVEPCSKSSSIFSSSLWNPFHQSPGADCSNGTILPAEEGYMRESQGPQGVIWPWWGIMLDFPSDHIDISLNIISGMWLLSRVRPIMIWDRPMAIMVAMNSWATSADKPKEGRLKSPRTISVGNSTDSRKLLRQGVCLQQGIWYTSNNANWSCELSFRNKDSHPEIWGARPLKVTRDFLIITATHDHCHPPPLSWLVQNPQPSWTYLWQGKPPFLVSARSHSLFHNKSLNVGSLIIDWTGIQQQQLKLWHPPPWMLPRKWECAGGAGTHRQY